MAEPLRRHRPAPDRPLVGNDPGLFTRADALEAAWTDSALRHAVRMQGLARVKRGVYGPVAEPVGPSHEELANLRLAQATARLCRRAVISHVPAVISHGLPVLGNPTRPCLTVSAGTALRNLAGIHLHRATLRPDDVVVVDGFDTTSVARSVTDLAREHGVAAGLVATDAALHDGRVTRGELGAAFELCRRWPGNKRARAVIELSDGRAESPLESLSRLTMLRRRLPTPEPQVNIADGYGRFVARTDFLWAQFGVVGEADGLVKYETRADVIAERRRERALTDLGLLVVRWEWSDLSAFEAVERRLRDAFAQGQAAPPGRWTVLPSADLHT